MKRTLILCIGALVLAAPASAHENRAKVSRAKLAATDAATAAGIPDARGRAQLVDGRKRNKVSLHMKGLKPGETYIWHVHQATGEGDPCAAGSTVGNPTPYPGWTYRELKARASGNANSKGRSSTFPVAEDDTGFSYYVNVHLQDGTVIACGVLERKRGGHQKGHAKREDAKSHGKSKADDKPKGGHGKPDHDD
jgi:hypothetical protein